jgi:secondary thiamine-phosphate synthase enzyme
MICTLQLHSTGPGLLEFTHEVAAVVGRSGCEEGLCTLFLRHTSASLLIQENADPAVRQDLQAWFSRLVPEGDTLYTHTAEGPDDMPSHIRSALTASSLAIPIANARLALGPWQGIYLFEHRRAAPCREVVVQVLAG